MNISSYESLDKIFVLSLLKNRTKVENKFSSLFSERDRIDRLCFFFTEGDKNNKNHINNGNYDASLQEILSHTAVDTISTNIFRNHISILEIAKNQNFETIMILEDDATWTQSSANKMIPIVNAYIKKNQNKFDMLYLGYINHPYICSYFNVFNFNIVRPVSPLTAHAVIITKQGIEKILYYHRTLYPAFNVHLDKFYSTCTALNKTAVFPQYIFQDKQPALYVKAMDKLGLKIPFNLVCKINEILSILVSFLLFLFLFLVVRKMVRKLLAMKKGSDIIFLP